MRLHQLTHRAGGFEVVGVHPPGHPPDRGLESGRLCAPSCPPAL